MLAATWERALLLQFPTVCKSVHNKHNVQYNTQHNTLKDTVNALGAQSLTSGPIILGTASRLMVKEEEDCILCSAYI